VQLLEHLLLPYCPALLFVHRALVMTLIACYSALEIVGVIIIIIIIVVVVVLAFVHFGQII